MSGGGVQPRPRSSSKDRHRRQGCDWSASTRSVQYACMRLSMPCLSMGWNFGQQRQFTPTFNNNKKAHIICFIQCVSDLQSCLFVVVTTSPIDTALSSFMVWWNKEGFKQLKGVTWPRYVRASCAFNQASSPKWSVRIWMCDLRPLHRVLNWKVFFYINICCFIIILLYVCTFPVLYWWLINSWRIIIIIIIISNYIKVRPKASRAGFGCRTDQYFQRQRLTYTCRLKTVKSVR